jgi:hypothetical protein
MAIGIGQSNGQRNSSGIGKQMVFVPQFAAIRGSWTCFSASAWSRQRSADEQSPVPIDLVGLLEFGQERLEEALPDPRFLPSAQSPSASRAGREVARSRESPPRDAGSQDEKNAINDTPEVAWFSAGMLNVEIFSPGLGE